MPSACGGDIPIVVGKHSTSAVGSGYGEDTAVGATCAIAASDIQCGTVKDVMQGEIE